MNRKFMPIFSQIPAYLFIIFCLPFHQNTPAFLREQDCILYTTEVSWLSANYYRINKKEKSTGRTNLFATKSLYIFDKDIHFFNTIEI